jgi:microcystin-dependent protein
MALTLVDPAMTDNVTPTGVVLPYAGSAAPNGWLLCFGQAISRTTYANLFAAIGTSFGTGDGSTTFNVPDTRGRVLAGKDNMGGTAASRLTTAGSGVDGATLGANGGAETHTLTTAQMPAHTHNTGTTIGSRNTSAGGGETIVYAGATYASTSVGGGGAHNNTQPTIVFNHIIKT